jgi:hypothetical protein
MVVVVIWKSTIMDGGQNFFATSCARGMVPRASGQQVVRATEPSCAMRVKWGS